VARVITVIGCDASQPPPGAEPALTSAALVIGAARHLSTVHSDAERIVLGDVASAVRQLAKHDDPTDPPAVVLASGDPGFFGIVRALRRAGLRPTVLPAISSVAHAFARLGLPWDDALVVSAHGRDLRRAVNACRAHRKVAVLTGPGAGPAELAHALMGGAAQRGVRRRLVVASRLGTPEERLTVLIGDPAELTAEPSDWADPNVVLVLADSGTRPDGRPEHDEWAMPWLAGRQPGPAGWALPEKAYVHRDSMITKAEVRALVLARLGPRVGDLVWDIGAGSGSVAVECARLGAAAIAVDRDPAAGELTEQNAAMHGVDIAVVTGAAPDVLAELPDPDAIFVGGGGPGVLTACAQRRPARLVTAIAAVDRIAPALAVLRTAGLRTDGVQLRADRLTPLPDGSHRLAATNPVVVLWGEAT
jgi:precorrin-6Y C5,15-methyltransferase (decarboxylating)